MGPCKDDFGEERRARRAGGVVGAASVPRGESRLASTSFGSSFSSSFPGAIRHMHTTPHALPLSARARCVHLDTPTLERKQKKLIRLAIASPLPFPPARGKTAMFLHRPPSVARGSGGALAAAAAAAARPIKATRASSGPPPLPRRRRAVAALASSSSAPKKAARPVQPGSNYPAGEFCSNCGLCDTPYIAHVRDSCAFLGDGMARLESMEERVHGRRRLQEPSSSPSSSSASSSSSSLPRLLLPPGYDELRFGVTRRVLFGRRAPGMPGAQWTGVVTSIACAMLEQGLVDAVVVTQPQRLAEEEEGEGDDDDGYDPSSGARGDRPDPFAPVPVVARSVEDIRRARGVRPTLAPTLAALSSVEALVGTGEVKRLLFVGVGCQVQALRAIEPYLGLEKLYVLGTNCVDNGRREGLGKFLRAAERALEGGAGGGGGSGGGDKKKKPPIRHYEFMADLQVHLMRRHSSGGGSNANGPPPPELLPYFSLPADELNDVIAPSCYSCFDYANGLADLTVGYMGVPYQQGVPMTGHPQYLTVRNDRGEEMLSVLPWASASASSSSSSSGPSAGGAVFVAEPPVSKGDRKPWVMSTLLSDDQAKLGEGPEKPAPLFVGRLLAWLLSFFTPKGLEFAAYSVDYHTLRNWIYVHRHMTGGGGGGGAGGAGGVGSTTSTNPRADQHIPSYAKKIVAEYERSSGGKISARVPLRPKPEAYRRPGFVWGPGAPVPKRGEVVVRVGEKNA